MNKNKNKITILILAITGMMIFSLGVEAANPSVYISPATTTKNMGESFELSVKVNPAGEKVCAVEGQLVLSKLSCQKIDLAEGIMPQTSPSFSNNLYFLLGIPGCTTQEKTLFTIKVKADTVSGAFASFKNVDIIGEGMSVSSAFVDGNYEITVPVAPITPPLSCVCDSWGSWQNRDCGEENCAPTQRLQDRVRVCTPSGCDVEKQTQCINDSTCIVLAKEKPEFAETVTQSSFLAAIGSVITSGTGRIIVSMVAILLLILAILAISKRYKKYRDRKDR